MLLILVLVGVLLYLVCIKYGIINQTGGSIGDMETVPPFIPVHLPKSITSVITSLEEKLSSLPSLPSLPSLTSLPSLPSLTSLPSEAERSPETPGEISDKYGWFCHNDFYAPITSLNGKSACLSEDGKNCSWGYCDGDKITKTLPTVQIPIICDKSSPDSWCSKIAQIIKNKKKVVEKLDETVDNTHEVLSEINKNLDRKGSLSYEEHQRIIKAAADLQKIEQQINTEEQILKSSQDQVERGVQEISKDETLAKNIVVHSVMTNDYEAKPLTLKNHITLIKGVLNNHNNRLRNLESYLCQVKSEMHSGKYLLKDMTNKLNDRVKPNKYQSASDTDNLTINTVNKVKESLKCPVCPMYERGLVSPTGDLDMWK